MRRVIDVGGSISGGVGCLFLYGDYLVLADDGTDDPGVLGGSVLGIGPTVLRDGNRLVGRIREVCGHDGFPGE